MGGADGGGAYTFCQVSKCKLNVCVRVSLRIFLALLRADCVYFRNDMDMPSVDASASGPGFVGIQFCQEW